MHCASRRSLRDDLDFDAFVNAVYPDVEKYEQEVDSSPTLSLIRCFWQCPNLYPLFVHPLKTMNQKRENGGLNT